MGTPTEPGTARQIKTIAEIVAFADFAASLLEPPDMLALGALVYFVALRDHGYAQPGFVLEATDRALDSFDPYISQADQRKKFEQGIETVRSALFENRGEPHGTLVDQAFRVLVAQATRHVGLRGLTDIEELPPT
jgi:hypothetical protein